MEPPTIRTRKSSGLRPGAVVAVAFAIFALVDFGAFRTGLYRSVLDPSSSTGSFEAAIDRFRTFGADRRSDVLVLGDSRIYSGLDPRVASAAAGRLRFLNGGVPGTTPRCWPFFVRAIDPRSDRLRAVVIPVDTYGDDTSAIGSLDGDDRPMDLRYVVFQTRVSDLPKLAGSFSDPRERVEYGIDLFWRAVELRDDFQAFAADPPARIRTLANPPTVSPYDPLASHARTESLAGLRVDFATNTIVYPAGMPDDQRQAIATQVLTVPKPSRSYGIYRRQWLEPIAAEYRAAGVPVIFVRIPTRPAHRLSSDVPTGSLLDIARATGALLLPAAPYLALERANLFADEDHLNREGSARFSRLLGHDVASVIAQGVRSTRPFDTRPFAALRGATQGDKVGSASRSGVVTLSAARSAAVEGHSGSTPVERPRVAGRRMAGVSAAPSICCHPEQRRPSTPLRINSAARVEGHSGSTPVERPHAAGPRMAGVSAAPSICCHPEQRRIAARVEGPRVAGLNGPYNLSWFAAAAGIGIPLRFQSYEFWLFLTIVAALFYGLPRRWGRYVLLLTSYYFYARWNAWYVLFLWILTASDFAIAIVVERERETRGRNPRVLLALGVAANLAFLGTFKYANFASGTVSALLGMHENPWLVNLFVPIGISFHTFQSISYLVDVYRGRMAAIRKPLDYALYLAFFPQLLAGPIVRAGLFFGELFAWRPPGPEDVSYGMARVGFGLVKKMAIADQFAPAANAYFTAPADHPGALAAWSAVFAFGMQIYFDFSGYSDIAIGCARLFGFVFPENFAMPYLATSITDFWHRWHITLSTWLRDYLYIPLGGSRYGTLATLRNLMLTMLLGGLWHGAQWTFVAWGGVHGAFLCVERLLGVGHGRTAPRGVALVARVALTFTLVSLAWVLFRSPTFATAAAVYRALVAGGAGASLLTGWQAVLAVGVVAFGAVRLFLEHRSAGPSWWQLRPLSQAGALACLLLALALLTWPGVSPAFIYFKF